MIIKQNDIGLQVLKFAEVHDSESIMFVRLVGDKEKFLQFKVKVDSTGAKAILLGFPKAPWSEKYYAVIRAKLEGHGIPIECIRTGDSFVTEFLQSEILIDDQSKQPRENLETLIKLVLSEMGLSPKHRLRVKIRGFFNWDCSIKFYSKLSVNPEVGWVVRAFGRLMLRASQRAKRKSEKLAGLNTIHLKDDV